MVFFGGVLLGFVGGGGGGFFGACALASEAQ